MAGKMHFETVPLTEIFSSGKSAVDARPVVVLIVDDEKVIADTLTAILTRSGYVAVAAYDGESALQQARITSPDMLITDVCMPGMGGIELAVAIRGSYPQCRVLLFSGQMSTVDLLVASRNAGYDFAAISKPIHPTELLAKVSESLSRRKEERCEPKSMPSPMEREERSA